MNILLKGGLFLGLLCSICCVKRADERLFLIEDAGQFGYISAAGDTVVPCVYPFAYTDTLIHIGFVVEADGKILCLNNKGDRLFHVFPYDNGPDYPQEGLFRIVDEAGAVGFADTLGNIIIPPRYKFAFPF